MSAASDAKARIMIYVPPELDQRIRLSAERAGQSLSVWLQRAAEARLTDLGDNDFCS